MELVEPIRSKKQIDAMKRYLKSGNIRDYLLFVLGINSGLRISDLLSLQMQDVKGKERISLREQKTGKTKDFPLSDTCQKAIKEYLQVRGMDTGFLFASRKGQGAISRVQAYRILNEAARAIGIKEQIGTHTLRKTFGYHSFQNGTSLELLMDLFNHSSKTQTLRYIGITEEQKKDVYLKSNLG